MRLTAANLSLKAFWPSDLRLATDLMNRAGDLILVADAIPGADPGPAHRPRGTESAYELNLELALRFDARGELQPGLNAATAADIMFTLSSNGVFHTLRRSRRCGEQRYQDWVITAPNSFLLTRRRPRREDSRVLATG